MLEIQVLRSNVLGVDVVRGFARLSDLSRISRADVFDEKSNPTGTQRDLSPKHARDAYEYARISDPGYWPEVFLCLRNSDCVRYLARADGVGVLHLDDAQIEASDQIFISRVDGNHRLHLADGHVEGVPAIDRVVSFCMAMNLELGEEIAIFRDINNNQKSMDTSHLDKIELRLSTETVVRQRDPALYIANKIANDEDSPLQGFVYQGGRRPPGTFIGLRALHSGVEYMLSRQTKLTALGDPDAQAKLIKNYFGALKRWVPEAWENPKEYLLLRGAGLWGSCFIGADVIDRALGKKAYSVDAMLDVLNSGPSWDWSRLGTFRGYSGRGGAVRIADLVIKEFKDDQGVSMNELLAQIINSKS